MGLGYHELVAQARREITEITPGELADRLRGAAPDRERLVLVDVREPDEHAAGAIADSVNLPRGVLESSAATRFPDRDVAIALYCSVGARSALAAKALQDMGFRRVASLHGGFEAWKTAGLPWGATGSLTPDQYTRYSRHLVLPEIGEAGQRALLDARVVVIGAGGLGSPAAMYLAAAGVGTLGVVDDDHVDLSNLHRQILHATSRLGIPKTESARTTLGAINPDITIRTHQTRLAASNVLQVLRGYDVIVDGADNFPTRYLVNDAALHLRTPVVHGSISRFEGQATVFAPYDGPCYRCLFPQPPPPELAPSCAEAGVLGVLPGIVGSIQALEAMKLVLGIGTTLVGRLLMYDALRQTMHDLAVPRDPRCQACADSARPPRLVDYDDTCRSPGSVPRDAKTAQP